MGAHAQLPVRRLGRVGLACPGSRRPVMAVRPVTSFAGLQRHCLAAPCRKANTDAVTPVHRPSLAPLYLPPSPPSRPQLCQGTPHHGRCVGKEDAEHDLLVQRHRLHSAG